MALLEVPDKNFTDIIPAFQQAAGAADFIDRPLAAYHLAYAHRLMGNAEYALAMARPNEMPQHLQVASQRFDDAAREFTAAIPLLAAQAKAHAPAADSVPSAEAEWLNRANCDLAEMLIRTNKFKEAKQTIEPLVNDPAAGKSRYHLLAVYHLGYANFALRDYVAAAAR